MPPAPSCQGLVGGFALAILSFKGEPAAPGPASPDCGEQCGASGTLATRSPLAAVHTLCLLSLCWGRGVGAGPAADVRGGGGSPSLDLSLPHVCVWCRLAFVRVCHLLIPVKEQQKAGSWSLLLDVGTQSPVATGAAGTASTSSRGTRFLSKERADRVPPGDQSAAALPLPRRPSDGRSPGTSPRGSVLGADKDSFLGDGPSGNCPLRLSRWEGARQSCGGRFVARGGLNTQSLGSIGWLCCQRGRCRRQVAGGSIAGGARSPVPCSWH